MSTLEELEDHSWLNSGGGSNPQCLPLDSNYLKFEPGKQTNSYIYGAEYELINGIVPNSHDTDVPCAVCYVPTRTTLYMMPAKYTCPKDWTTEYYGYLMAGRNYRNHYRSHFTCVDNPYTNNRDKSRLWRSSILFCRRKMWISSMSLLHENWLSTCAVCN